MKARVIVYSDYVCPFCYIGKKVLDRMKADLKDLEVELALDWKAYELRPEGFNLPPPPPDYLEAAWRNVGRLADEYGVEIHRPSKRTSSSLALQAAEFAKAKGRFDELHSVLFDSLFIEDEDIGDLELVKRKVEGLGLDAGLWEEEVRKGLLKTKISEQRLEGERLGVSGVPTFFIGGRRVVGAQPYEVLMASATEAITMD